MCTFLTELQNTLLFLNLYELSLSNYQIQIFTIFFFQINISLTEKVQENNTLVSSLIAYPIRNI